VLLTSLLGAFSANCGGSSSSLDSGLGIDGGGAGGTAGCANGDASYGKPGCGSGSGGSSGVSCDSSLFDNGNTGACTTPTNTSVFTLSSTSTVTSLRLWINTTLSGQTVSYTLLNAAGTTLGSGPTIKGGCDPYQTNWCEFLVTLNMTLQPGTYTVKSSAVATCANSGSKSVGFIAVKGCASPSQSLDATAADAPGISCNSSIFDNGNTGACTTPTNTSVFTLPSTSTVTSLRLWTNTTLSGQSVSYTLLDAAGTTLSAGPTSKGACDPYQTNWCEFLVTMTMTLQPGTYTVKSSAVATCANSGSNNVGFIAVKGCSGSSSTPDGGTADSPVDSGAADAPPTYFAVSTPPTAISGPVAAKISALKMTTTFGVGGIFWKDGRLFAISNSGGPIVSVMPGETGTLWATVPSLQGGNPSWRHGVPLFGGNVLVAIDYYGGPTGLHEITPTGTDTAWTLAQDHAGIGDLITLPNGGGWVFSDFERYGIFKVAAKNAPETSLIPAGSLSFSPAYLAHDASTDTIYFVNMSNLGSDPWFGGDGAIYKLATGAAPALVASAPTGSRFTGLAIGLGGLFPAGLYAADPANSRVVRVESTGSLTPVVVGVPTPSEIRIDPASKGMALFSADLIIFVLP
jgi:hypothetical protein